MEQTALHVYRSLLRATRLAFQGDQKILHAARLQARQQFHEPQSDVAAALDHARDVTKILRENVVQGVKESEEEEERFKLRIHEATERGDNETIRLKTGLKGRVGRFGA